MFGLQSLNYIYMLLYLNVTPTLVKEVLIFLVQYNLSFQSRN